MSKSKEDRKYGNKGKFSHLCAMIRVIVLVLILKVAAVAGVNSTTRSPTRSPAAAPVAAGPAPTASPVTLSTVRINCGSDFPFTDQLTGNIWSRDMYARNGTKYSRCPANISNTDLDTLYCSERNWAGPNGTMGMYVIPVIPGQYTVRLYVAETFVTRSNTRLFNISLQNTLLQSNVDIFALAGGMNTALRISSNPWTGVFASASDSNIRIEFRNVKQNAKISAIEIIPYTPVVPTRAPTLAPTAAPTAPVPFNGLLLNTGSNVSYLDSLARVWRPDRNFVGGTASSIASRPIENTVDDTLYCFERVGSSFQYNISVPMGVYEINFYFAETQFTTVGQRVFDIRLENDNVNMLRDIDIIQLSGAPNTAVRLQVFQLVEDGRLTIEFMTSATRANASFPKINAIEVKLDKPHICHAVATGPYFGTVSDPASNTATVKLIGSTSHTHGEGLNMASYQWKIGNTVFSTLPDVEYNFTTGNTTISLTVADDGGNQDTEVTTVSIRPFGFPTIVQLVPRSGGMSGGYDVLIRGAGFNYSAEQITVYFGETTIAGSANLQVVDSRTIKVKAPSSVAAVSVRVIVRTPLGDSEASDFEYLGSVPILWESGQIMQIDQPTVGRFGPDMRLYVGTRFGKLFKITMNDDFTAVTNVITRTLPGFDAILGVDLDPMDRKEHPDVYFTYNDFFHSGTMSSSGTTINGRIMRASGPALETIVNVITGLPVSGLDHGLNAIVFGDEGQLYFNSGSHTNGGVPGRLSTSGVLKENFLSAAVNVAYMSHPDFNGTIAWSSPDDGNMIARGIDVYGAGLRNPYGLLLHSNGKLYASDNGPNFNYGRMSTGCGDTLADSIDDQFRIDKLIHVQPGHYYGSPNKKRASYFDDPRQCVWRPLELNSSAEFTAPIMTTGSSLAGIVEFHGNHFGGQLRGNIIMFRYNANLLRAILTEDGTALVPSLGKKPLTMNIGSNGLDVTQAPNGNLIEMRYGNSSIWYQKPIEPATTALTISTASPRRGPNSGGNPLYIFGMNFLSSSGAIPSVLVGGTNCPVTIATSTRIICTLPGGVGKVDIVVTNGASGSLFSNGYRYISGVLPPNFTIPVYTGK